jgi:hypothetical protein
MTAYTIAQCSISLFGLSFASLDVEYDFVIRGRKKE